MDRSINNHAECMARFKMIYMFWFWFFEKPTKWSSVSSQGRTTKGHQKAWELMQFVHCASMMVNSWHIDVGKHVRLDNLSP